MSPRLLWIYTLQIIINQATEGDLRSFVIEDDVDPLKKHVVFTLSKGWCSKNYKPFQVIAHEFAKANECYIEKIRHPEGKLILDLCIKRRLGPPMNKNPMR